MLWLVPLLCSVIGIIGLLALASSVQREVGPTDREIKAFGRSLRPIVVEVRDDARRLRERLDRGSDLHR
jgi:hypothetical protein